MSTHVVKLRKDGALNIPVDLRTAYGLRSGMKFEIKLSATGITYAPSVMMCPICGEKMKPRASISVMGQRICRTCNNSVMESIRSGKVTTIDQAFRSVQDMHKTSKGTARIK